MGWAQESSSSLSIQHAHFSIACEILQNQTGKSQGEKKPSCGHTVGKLVLRVKAEIGDSL